MKAVKLERVRSFSETFQDTILFIRQNFNVLGKGVLYIAGPFYLLVYVVNILFLYDVTIRRENVALLFMESQTSWAFILALLFQMLASMMAVGTVAYYFAMYREYGGNNFTVGDLAKRVFSRFPALLGTTLLLTLFFGVFMFIFAAIFGGMVTLGAGAAVLVVLLLLVGMLLLAFPLWYYFFAIYISRATEKIGVFEAMGRVRWGMSGNWWTTWLVMFCFGLCLYVVGLSTGTPQAIYAELMKLSAVESMMSEDTSRIILSALNFIATFVGSYIAASAYVMIGIHYFSLKERVEGQGMYEQIEQIGRAKPTEIETTY